MCLRVDEPVRPSAAVDRPAPARGSPARRSSASCRSAMWKPSRYACGRRRRCSATKLLRRLAGLLGGDHDRRAVRVVGADEVHLVPLHALEAHPDVGLDVLHDVADVERAVGVRQGGGDEEACGGIGGSSRKSLSLAWITGAKSTLLDSITLQECTHMPVTEQDVQAALKEIVDPNTGKDLVATRSVQNIKVAGERRDGRRRARLSRRRPSSSRCRSSCRRSSGPSPGVGAVQRQRDLAASSRTPCSAA